MRVFTGKDSFPGSFPFPGNGKSQLEYLCVCVCVFIAANAKKIPRFINIESNFKIYLSFTCTTEYPLQESFDCKLLDCNLFQVDYSLSIDYSRYQL